jgi:glycosyltransferase involved in cell wall biosynthesis
MVSIVITAYNVEKYLEKCVRSTFQDGVKEVIIVVDKPTDNTLEIAKRLEKENSLVYVIENEVNVGAGLSRRYGINKAKGEYVLLLDGDDYLDDNYIAPLLQRAKETDADIVSSGIKIINEDGSWKGESYGNTTTIGNDKLTRFWGERVVFMNNKIIRRYLYNTIPYNHRRFIEDTPTIIPILWIANKVEYVDMLGYNYVMRQESLTHTTNQLKDVIYKGLCWLDLMDFFNKYDKTVFDAIDIKGYLKNIIKILNTFVAIQPAHIEPYKDDWIEFTTRMVNLLSVNNVSFKYIETDDKK